MMLSLMAVGLVQCGKGCSSDDAASSSKTKAQTVKTSSGQEVSIDANYNIIPDSAFVVAHLNGPKFFKTPFPGTLTKKFKELVKEKEPEILGFVNKAEGWMKKTNHAYLVMLKNENAEYGYEKYNDDNIVFIFQGDYSEDEVLNTFAGLEGKKKADLESKKLREHTVYDFEGTLFCFTKGYAIMAEKRRGWALKAVLDTMDKEQKSAAESGKEALIGASNGSELLSVTSLEMPEGLKKEASGSPMAFVAQIKAINLVIDNNGDGLRANLYGHFPAEEQVNLAYDAVNAGLQMAKMQISQFASKDPMAAKAAKSLGDIKIEKKGKALEISLDVSGADVNDWSINAEKMLENL